MKALSCIAAFLLTASVSVMAESASPVQISGTATITSDYVFKGMTQSWGGPAVQGSIDLSTDTGFVGSIWASTLSKKAYAGSNVEVDVYGGYRRPLGDDWTVGGGVTSVYYLGGNYNKIQYLSLPSQRYDFVEASAFVTYKWVTLKYSYSLTDLLGFNQKTGYTGGTKGSTYLDLSADIPISDGWLLNLHAGHQNVTANLVVPTANGSTNPDFNDYRIGLTRQLEGGFVLSGVVAWNSNTKFFNNTASTKLLNDTKDVGKHRFVLTVTKAF